MRVDGEYCIGWITLMYKWYISHSSDTMTRKKWITNSNTNSMFIRETWKKKKKTRIHIFDFLSRLTDEWNSLRVRVMQTQYRMKMNGFQRWNKSRSKMGRLTFLTTNNERKRGMEGKNIGKHSTCLIRTRMYVQWTIIVGSESYRMYDWTLFIGEKLEIPGISNT